MGSFLGSLGLPLALAALLRTLVLRAQREAEAQRPQEPQEPRGRREPLFKLRVIGMGAPRTGTQSLHLALDALGYRTLHGGAHIHINLTAMGLWRRGPEGLRQLLGEHLERGDFDAAADLDEESYAYLYDNSRDVRVVLTVHPNGPHGWVSSIDRLAKWKVAHPEIAPTDTGVVDVWAPDCIVPKYVPLSPDMRASCERAYFNRNEHLKRIIPAGTLLEYSSSQGWGPLCAFLGKQVPDIPFPRIDTVACFEKKGKEECSALFQSLVVS